MNRSAILAFVAAFFGVAMAVAVASQARRSTARRWFAGGMLVLESESGFACLGLDAASQWMMEWDTYRLMAAGWGRVAECGFFRGVKSDLPDGLTEWIPRACPGI